jgi:hypothetical protein
MALLFLPISLRNFNEALRALKCLMNARLSLFFSCEGG